MVDNKRYELKIGEFGCYFYDNVISKDMTTEMVLNKLNDIHDKNIKEAKKKNERAKKLYQYLKKQYSRLE